MREIASLTASAAREAIHLYFEPIRRLRKWLRGPDDCNDGTGGSPATRTLFVDEVRDEHLVESNLQDLAFEELLKHLEAQIVFVTCAGHPAATRIATHLAERARQVCLVDSEHRRIEVLKRWRSVVGPVARSRLKYRFGNLADESWLCSTLESERPSVIFDFTTHAYLRARIPAGIDRRSRAARSYQYVYDKAEVITNIVRCSAAIGTVRSVFLVMPRFAENEAVDHFERLYSLVLRDYAVALGAHSAPEEPTISLWEPKQRSLLFHIGLQPALTSGSIEDDSTQ